MDGKEYTGGNKVDFKFKLGDRVKDSITGYTGVITRRTQWLNNCNTYGVQAIVLKDGLPMDAQAFDEMQLLLVDKDVATPYRNTGGPDRPVPKTMNM